MSRLSKESAFCSVVSTSQECLEEETPTSASNRTMNVTLLSSEWKSTKGGLSTISRELAIQLAKHPDVEVSVYLPQCSEEDKRIAAGLNVKIIEAEELPGYEPVDWLGSVPDNHAMDCVIGHGVHLGRQIPLIKRQSPHCKWVQIVHTAPEDLGMYKSYEEAISKGEQKHQGEVKLCELADQVVAVGPKLADAFARYLRPSKKDQDVLTLTPSIFNEFLGVEQATEERRTFCVLVFGRGDSEDFKLKGYDIAVQAVAELKDTSYQLMFVGAPAGKEDEVAERLLQHGIPPSQLTVRRFKESRDQLANLFCEVDLAIMPSRTEGFGLTALEALSAGLPVLVSGNSGLGVALKEVAYGSQCVVDSEDPKEWAKKIKAVREKSREVRLAESKLLRSKYLEKFKWQESCGLLLEKMQNLVFGLSERKGQKAKRPLSLSENQPSKRPRGESTHHEGPSGYGRPASSVEYSQLPLTPVTQSSTQLYQTGHVKTSHVESPSGLVRPPLTMQYNHVSFPGTTTQAYGEATYQGSHTQSTVTHNEQSYQRRFALMEGSFGRDWPPSSVTCSQSPFVTAAPALDEPSVWKSHTQPSSSCYGRPSSSAEYNQFPVDPVTQSSTLTYQRSHPQSFPGLLPTSLEYNQFPSTVASQTYGGCNNSRGHTHSFSGHDMPPSSVGYTQVPFTAAPQSYQPSRALSVVVKFLQAEYKRRSLLKPLLWENTIRLPLEDVYTRLKIVSRRKRDFQLQNDEVSMYGIFEDQNDVVVLVEGSPGIGKTTFCLKIVYDWAKQQIPKGYSFPEFVVVLLLKCRDIDGDVMDAIVEQLLPERMEETVKKEFMDFIEDFHYQEKVLIILDGLDELPKESESHVDQLLCKKILPFSYVLVTSRQERGIAVRQKVDFDILLQIQGFTEEDAFEYIRKHFRYAGPEYLATGERLITQIKENTFLHALPSNPLNLLLLCVVFEDYHGELPSFRTELYQIIIRCLLRRYCAKHNLEAPGDDQALEKLFEDSLLVLGELAWRCLLEGRFSFREEELATFESRIKDLAARELGLVFKEASMKKLNPQHEYHFFHKTFQEYLAATYLAHKLLKEGENVFCEFELYFEEHVAVVCRQVFLFVSGILGKDAGVLFKQIGETLVSDGWDWLTCSEEEATFFTESFSESQNAEQMAMTLCSFIPFPLTVEITMLETELVDREETANILMVAEACRNFPQLQHPVHLTIEMNGNFSSLNYEMVAQFLVSCPKLQTFSFRILGKEDSVTPLFEGLSRNSSISSFTFRDKVGIILDEADAFGDSLAANKTLTTVTLELINECSDAWASALERGLSADTPFTSVVLKIYGSLSAKAIGAFERVLSNRSLTSLTLIIYGEMQDSLATSVGETLVSESILKSLNLIVYGTLSYSGAVSLERGFLENSALSSLELKVFGELPDNWVTVAEKVLEAKKTKMSVAFYPNITGTISKAQVTRLCPGFELQSLTLNLWGELSCCGADALSNVLITLSMSCVTLNIYGKVTDNVAECLVSYLKPCKTLSSLSINIWGELTRAGSSALQELVCIGKYSVALNVCSVASDDWICKDLNTSLTTRSLAINNCSDPSGDWGSGLGDGLAKKTSLTTLSHTINNYSDLSGVWGHGLGDGLAKNTSLTTLSLTLNNCSDLSGDWECGLGDGLAKNTSLTTLSLTINDYSDPSGVWAHGLGDGLGKNTSLTTLSLTINDYRDPSGVWAHGLGDGLAKNTSLTTLSLTINNCSDLWGDWAPGLGVGLAKNTSLTRLSLSIKNCIDLSGGWAHGLGDGLAKNTSLTTLSLTINNCSDPWGDWAHGLGDVLAKNTSLTTLSLTINNCSDLREVWARGLSDRLAENTSLTALCLTINNCSDLSGDWGRGLGDGLAINTSLPTLSLTINNCGDLSGDWGRGLGDGLAVNTSLTTLSLTIDNYSYLYGCWACGLGYGLAINTSLTTLSLTINNYSYLTRHWAFGLDDGLAKNTSLTTLSLTLNNYSDLSGDWTHYLGDGLERSKSLTVVNVIVTTYIKWNEEWLFGLCNSLAKSDTITALNVTFNDLSGASEAFELYLGKYFADCKLSPSVNLIVSLYGEAAVGKNYNIL